MTTLYKNSGMGICLTETLEEMILTGTLSPELAYQVLIQFDKSMAKALKTSVENRVSIRGHLHTYQYCDDVWKFFIQDAVVTHQNTDGIRVEEHVDSLRILACDSSFFRERY